MSKNLVTCQWLKEHMDDKNIRILDCRFELGKPNAGFEAYLEDHIPNAIYVDLEKDMSRPVRDHGGRHPLPNLEDFSAKLAAIGIDETMTVVAYDDQGGAMASRLWWLLKYVGHKDVFVLSTSYSNWKNNGFEITTMIPHFDHTKFTVALKEEMLSTMEDIRASIQNEDVILIDSRDPLRFLGIEEPIDKKAGHIPSAKNYFWKDCLNENGEWKKREEQKERFNDIEQNKEIIVYCGSGVTACPNVLCLQSLGYENVKLYLGSWSDWISYNENEIEK
ncbi:sulfurtransferase [Anaerobacillus isosaccharinicus]|uniref:Sulfurtransferase n=1 Tax=Anaerobacillus isosaccharinicus TaxID=1532552 RepID=A0A1S2KX05_9BACI|nr:sulfurtransferase [Anaerobacillus isosaccharinicus]MBA5585907.1 sulfurtransferase [Anaerobacillus isosaccharinicus]QOY35804.1 sulfurtransferase [Anaerobacillus isosaccharinicus]